MFLVNVFVVENLFVNFLYCLFRFFDGQRGTLFLFVLEKGGVIGDGLFEGEGSGMLLNFFVFWPPDDEPLRFAAGDEVVISHDDIIIEWQQSFQ